MSRQIVVTCEHGAREGHKPLDIDWASKTHLFIHDCPGGVPLDLGSLPPAAIEAAAMKIKDRDKLRDEGRLPKSDRERGLLALSVLDTFLSVLMAEPQTP